MALVTAGTAKNAVMILQFKTLPSGGSSDVKFRGTSYAVSLGWSAGGSGFAIMKGSTTLATGSGTGIGSNMYVRLTANDSNLSFAQFGTTSPPQSGGTPRVNTTAVDTSFLISGTWQYDDTYFTLVSFTSLDVTSNTVSYVVNGGTGTAPATQTGATSYTVSANTFTRDGYTFKNWNTKADGTGTSYAPGSTITTSATLYAQWTQNKVRTIESFNAPVLNAQSLGADVQRVYSFGVLVWER